MIKKNRNIFFVLLLLVFLSCEKAEKPYTLSPKGACRMLRVDLGSDYKKMAFVNIEDSSIYLADNKCWELAFDASIVGNLIYVNGGKYAFIANTGKTTFIPSLDYSSLIYSCDPSNGNVDSLAMKNWCNANNSSKQNVYAIDRGVDIALVENRFKQFIIRSVSDSGYWLTFSNYSGTDTTTIFIEKDHSKNLVYFNFENKGIVLNFEPEKTQWHFCFNQYAEIFDIAGKPTPYELTGVFINPSKIIVAVDSINEFEKITPELAKTFQYKNTRNTIGYDWKIYDQIAANYTIRKHVNYILQTIDSNRKQIWKLRFIDFYNNGIKGSPKFEYLRIE